MRSIKIVPMFLVALGLSCTAGAQTWPTKAIRVIAPYLPGNSDLHIRGLAPVLEKILGQPLVIENRPGAGGVIGTEMVKKAEPDGYTLLMVGSSALTVLPHLRPTPYALEDFTPVANLTATPLVLAVRADGPYTNFKEFIAYAKRNPGKLTLGSGGTGTASHIVAEVLQNEAGIKFTHVPFQALPPAVAGMLSGDIDMVVGFTSVTAPHVATGKFRFLSSTASKRSSSLPDVPTWKESGVDFVDETKITLVRPKGMPPDVLKRLDEAVRQATATQAYNETMTKAGIQVMHLGSAELASVLKADSNFWEKQFRDNPGLRALKGQAVN